MVDDEIVLRVERLRDSLEEFRAELRRRYKKRTARISAVSVREEAAMLAERWLVEIVVNEDVGAALQSEQLADLNVEFQRLLTHSERTSTREKYDKALKAILDEFRANVIVVLKQARGRSRASDERGGRTNSPKALESVFVGQSFAEVDGKVNELIARFLSAFGLDVVTGERPKADRISTKVRSRIDDANLFVGVFTRRDKLAGGQGWAASAWIIDEKAYALAKGKPLILLKEQGVKSVGGLQGDYEYLEFERDALEALLVDLLEVLASLRREDYRQ